MSEAEAKTAEILKPFGEFKTPGVCETVIELLEAALASAKGGETVAIGIVSLNAVGHVRTRAHAGTAGMAAIVGAVAVMQDDLIRLWKQND